MCVVSFVPLCRKADVLQICRVMSLVTAAVSQLLQAAVQAQPNLQSVHTARAVYQQDRWLLRVCVEQVGWCAASLQHGEVSLRKDCSVTAASDKGLQSTSIHMICCRTAHRSRTHIRSPVGYCDIGELTGLNLTSGTLLWLPWHQAEKHAG